MELWGEPGTAQQVRRPTMTGDVQARNTGLGILLVASLGAMGSIFVPWVYPVTLSGSPAAVAITLVSTPVICFAAYAVARQGHALAGATIALVATALGAVVVSYAAPALVPVASTFFMLTTVVLLAGWLMPFEYAAVLGTVNVAAAVAVPNFLPTAGPTSLHIPYIFLLANAAFLVFAMLIVQRERHINQLMRAEVADLRGRYQQDTSDLRAQVELEHDLAETRQQILQAASHELRTPITPLLIQITAFQRRHGGTLTEEQAQGIDLLERNLRRLAHLVDDLLDIAKMENGRLRIRRVNMDLAEVCVQAQRTFQQQAQDQKVALRVHVEGDTRLYGDGARLSQVLFNLLGNALKFTPRGGSIEILVAERNNGVRCIVKDTGPGLSLEQKAGLFRPFSQVHEDASKKGNGLGLYISQGIVQRHGGRIWAHSDGPGTGSEFGFWLPDSPPPPDRPAAGPARDAHQAVGSVGSASDRARA